MTTIRKIAVFVLGSYITACGVDAPSTDILTNDQGQFFQGCFDHLGLVVGQHKPSSESDKRQSADVSVQTNGIAQIFDRNSNGNLIDVPLTLVGDGTLTSEDFITATGDIPRANDANHSFRYDPSDVLFAEASLFANATLMMEWFKDLGFDTKNEQIGIGVHAEISGSVNNAMYFPGLNGSMSTIRIGDGDGVVLQNLAFDADVIAHELGHHVVFRKLRNMNSDTFVVHEALADFFTMIRNDDACLAPTICPPNSDVCVETSLCLRNANNDLKWNDPEMRNSRWSVKGQVVSGMLWDMKLSQQISKEELTQLVFNAINFLEDARSLSDFIDALVESDQELFNGKYRNLIESSAIERELI